MSDSKLAEQWADTIAALLPSFANDEDFVAARKTLGEYVAMILDDPGTFNGFSSRDAVPVISDIHGVEKERDDLKEKLEAAGMRWPQTVAQLEKALESFPAGRIWLLQWTESDVRASRAEHTLATVERERDEARADVATLTKWDERKTAELLRLGDDLAQRDRRNAELEAALRLAAEWTVNSLLVDVKVADQHREAMATIRAALRGAPAQPASNHVVCTTCVKDPCVCPMRFGAAPAQPATAGKWTRCHGQPTEHEMQILRDYVSSRDVFPRRLEEYQEAVALKALINAYEENAAPPSPAAREAKCSYCTHGGPCTNDTCGCGDPSDVISSTHSVAERLRSLVERMNQGVTEPDGVYRGHCRWCSMSAATAEERHYPRCVLAELEEIADASQEGK